MKDPAAVHLAKVGELDLLRTLLEREKYTPSVLNCSRSWANLELELVTGEEEELYYGDTPLIAAARQAQEPVVRFLLLHGADPTLSSCTEYGFGVPFYETAVEAAERGLHCVEYLLKLTQGRDIPQAVLYRLGDITPGEIQRIMEKRSRYKVIITMLKEAEKHWRVAAYASHEASRSRHGDRRTLLMDRNPNRPKDSSQLALAVSAVEPPRDFGEEYRDKFAVSARSLKEAIAKLSHKQSEPRRTSRPRGCHEVKGDHLKDYNWARYGNWSRAEDQSAVVYLAGVGDLHLVQEALHLSPALVNVSCYQKIGHHAGDDEDDDDEDEKKEGHNDTPLIAAARQGHVNVVRFLLLHGADPSLQQGTVAPETAESAARTGLQSVEKLVNDLSSDEPLARRIFLDLKKAPLSDGECRGLLRKLENFRSVVQLLQQASKVWRSKKGVVPKKQGRNSQPLVNLEELEANLDSVCEVEVEKAAVLQLVKAKNRILENQRRLQVPRPLGGFAPRTYRSSELCKDCPNSAAAGCSFRSCSNHCPRPCSRHMVRGNIHNYVK